MDKNQVIAVEEGIKRVVNNKKLYIRLLTNFSGRKLVEQIVEAVEQNDYQEAVAKCHALRGTAANLAMHVLTSVSGDLEKQLAENNDPGELIQKLQASLEEVEAEIEKILAEG